jgi:hypothetical protein
MQLIADLENMIGTRVLVFITGDRRGMETRIAMDSYPLIFKHLVNLGATKTVSIFIYTPGGDALAAYGIANLVRQFADSYSVIVPYKALSAGTLITLGADTIYMTRGGLLSPVDPSVTTPLGPRVPIPGVPNAQATVPVNVEDVSGYHKLATEEWKLQAEENWSEAFRSLTENVHPLALGAVHRAREQIAFLATTLLSKHMRGRERIKRIVTLLTRERFSHGYLIGRREAKEVLHLPLADVSQELEGKITELFGHYESLLDLNSPYNQEALLGTNNTATATINRGVIESSYTTNIFRTVRTITRVSTAQGGLPQEGYLERNLQEAWVEDKSV